MKASKKQMYDLSHKLDKYTEEFVSLIERFKEEKDSENAEKCMSALRSLKKTTQTLIMPLDYEEWKAYLIKERLI